MPQPQEMPEPHGLPHELLRKRLRQALGVVPELCQLAQFLGPDCGAIAQGRSCAGPGKATTRGHPAAVRPQFSESQASGAFPSVLASTAHVRLRSPTDALKINDLSWSTILEASRRPCPC